MPKALIAPNHPQTKEAFFAREAETWARLTATWRGLPVSPKKLLSICVRQQIGWWIKYATYGHYSEHIAGLQKFRQQFILQK